MSAYTQRYCRLHGVWDDDVDCSAEGCPTCIEQGLFKTREQLERELAAAQAALVEAKDFAHTEITKMGCQLDELHAKLAKYEQAKMPEEPSIYSSDPTPLFHYLAELRTCAAALQAEVDGNYQRIREACDEAIAKAVVRAAENESLRKDAERYRWLKERYSAADSDYRDFGLRGQRGRSVAIFTVPNPWPFSFDYEKAAELMDAAIDAALKDAP